MSEGVDLQETSSPDNTNSLCNFLDKKVDGSIIYLGWNAFDSAGRIKDNDVKDVATRFFPERDFYTIIEQVRNVMVAKRAQILAFAKGLVAARIVAAFDMNGVKTCLGTKVNSKEMVRQYYKEADSKEHQEIIYRCVYQSFDDSVRWQDDVANDLATEFGIAYDPITLTGTKNNRGNGFYEKIATKALGNYRADLKNIQVRSNPYFKARTKKRSHEESHKDGKYCRKSRSNKKV